jgi:hypothetical protein
VEVRLRKLVRADAPPLSTATPARRFLMITACDGWWYVE